MLHQTVIFACALLVSFCCALQPAAAAGIFDSARTAPIALTLGLKAGEIDVFRSHSNSLPDEDNYFSSFEIGEEGIATASSEVAMSISESLLTGRLVVELEIWSSGPVEISDNIGIGFFLKEPAEFVLTTDMTVASVNLDLDIDNSLTGPLFSDGSGFADLFETPGPSTHLLALDGIGNPYVVGAAVVALWPSVVGPASARWEITFTLRPVPEPSTLVLAAMGLGCAAACHAKRRNMRPPEA